MTEDKKRRRSPTPEIVKRGVRLITLHSKECDRDFAASVLKSGSAWQLSEKVLRLSYDGRRVKKGRALWQLFTCAGDNCGAELLVRSDKVERFASFINRDEFARKPEGDEVSAVEQAAEVETWLRERDLFKGSLVESFDALCLEQARLIREAEHLAPVARFATREGAAELQAALDTVERVKLAEQMLAEAGRLMPGGLLVSIRELLGQVVTVDAVAERLTQVEGRLGEVEKYIAAASGEV